jgi:release factor glutamine methyltransferase
LTKKKKMKLDALVRQGATLLEKAGVENPRMESLWLLAFGLGLSSAQVIIRGSEEAKLDFLPIWEELIRRRLAGEPLAYITGRQPFYDLDFIVTPEVLIPRPETEVLVAQAWGFLKNKTSPKVLDVGTGSGAIAVSLAKNLPRAKIWAVDISPEALKVAQANALANQVSVNFILGDLWDAPFNEVIYWDAVCANLPYVKSGDCPQLPLAVQSEPKLALDGGVDGLSLVRRLLKNALGRMQNGGRIFLEVAPGQTQTVKNILESDGWVEVMIVPDSSGLMRVVTGAKQNG